MKTKIKKDLRKIFFEIWPLLLIFSIIFIFLARLFFPPSIFVTPDFGRSDILNIQLPSDFITSQSLRHFNIPLWTGNAAQGYPLYAELMSTFYIPNLIIFFLLPFEFAIPTIYLINFLIAAFGMYFFLRSQKMERLPGIIGALSFVFSASIILRVQHLGILEAISLLPFCLKFFLDVLNKPNKINLIVLSFLFSQMLFGFPQIFVYTAISFSFLALTDLLFKKNKKIKRLFFSALVILFFTFAFGAIQFFPSYELLKESSRGNGVDPQTILTGFPFTAKNLLTFINPFISGSAANGTYNFLNWKIYGIFWENNAYFGFLPFVSSILGIIFIFLKNRKSVNMPIAATAILTLSLALGALAPTHILFSFPPISFFRVPARFIMLTQFFLVIISAYFLNLIYQKLPKKIGAFVLSIVLIITVSELFLNWWNYNPIGKISTWTGNITTANFINTTNKQNGRILTINAEGIWDTEFTKSGWQNNLDKYLYFQNALDPNTNFYTGIQSFGSYQILQTRRQDLLESILTQDIKITKDSIEIGDVAKKILNLANVRYLITTIPVNLDNFNKIYQITKYNISYYVYENLNVHTKYNLFYNYKTVSNVGDYITAFQDENLNSRILLENPPQKKLQQGEGIIKLNKETENSLDLEITTNHEAILQYASSYYPGWRARIDHKPVKIYAADINSKAIFVPAGEHQVSFYYQPFSFLIGTAITLLTLIISIIIIFSNKLKLIYRSIKAFLP